MKFGTCFPSESFLLTSTDSGTCNKYNIMFTNTWHCRQQNHERLATSFSFRKTYPKFAKIVKVFSFCRLRLMIFRYFLHVCYQVCLRLNSGLFAQRWLMNVRASAWLMSHYNTQVQNNEVNQSFLNLKVNRNNVISWINYIWTFF